MTAFRNTSDIKNILSRLLTGEQVDKPELRILLSLSDPKEVEQLFSAARKARSRYFGTGVFLYGFLYFSTYCRNNCNFCQFRSSNVSLQRYRKSDEEIRSAALEMAQSGVHLIDFTMGEDPHFSSDPGHLQHLMDVIMGVKDDVELPIMISPGVVPDAVICTLAESGVDWYACYQETHNVKHYQYLRCGQSYIERLEKKRLARREGMLVEEGILLGTGENIDDVIDSLLFMQKEGFEQVRAMTFIPHPGVTIDGGGEHTSSLEVLTIAVMRLLMPDRLIPASLDVDGLDGLAARLNAGANVVTSIVPPERGLAGVVNKSLDIEDSRRTMESIIPILKNCGLEVAAVETYRDWLLENRLVSNT